MSPTDGAVIHTFMGSTRKNSFTSSARFGKYAAARLAVVYFLAATAYIACSDWLVKGFESPELEASMQTWKGFGFVWLTSLLLYFTVGAMEARWRREISQREEAEAVVREAEARFRQLAENVGEVFWLTDVSKEQMLYVSPAYEAIWGQAVSSLLASPRSWLDLVHPEDRDRIELAVQRQASGDYDEIYRIVRPDGEVRWLRDRAFAVHDESGQVYRVAGVATDITPVKMAQEALQEVNERFHLALSEARMGVWEWNLEEGSFYLSAELLKLLKLTESPPSLEFLTDLVHPEDRERVGFQARNAMSSRQASESEFRVVLACGEVRWLSNRAGRPSCDASGRPERVVGFVLDVTDLKKSEEINRALEDRLRQAEKMEAIGQLAGGVAHDFNNLLTVIQGNLAIAGHSPTIKAEDSDLLREALQASHMAAQLIRQLLMFGRRQLIEPVELDISNVLKELSGLLERTLGETVEIVLQLAGDLPPVRADRSMIDQIVLNLAVNARDAMPGGGRLTLATGLVELDKEQAAGHSGARSGIYVVIRVQDSGTGISPEHLEHIFEPFFTTKEVGRGTGLGLASVYGIVKQHEGFMLVTSKPGQGSTFEVLLPALTASSPSPATQVTMLASSAHAPEATTPTDGANTILLVEDDERVRSLITRILTRAGHRVLGADSGPAALRVWQQHREEIQLLLTDLVMPGNLSGRQLARVLRADRPDLRVLLTSGYSREELAHSDDEVEGVHFLPKPYVPQQVLDAVSHCLQCAT